MTKLPKVSVNQFSLFYSIIGHFQRPLNSNFSPFTGQAIEKCKNSFALENAFAICHFFTTGGQEGKKIAKKKLAHIELIKVKPSKENP